MAVTSLKWIGPYSFFNHRQEVAPATLDGCGLYMLTVPVCDKHLAYKPGMTEVSFHQRPGTEVDECCSGRWWVHDVVETSRLGKLSPGIQPYSDLEKAAQWARFLQLFLALCPDRGRIKAIERAIHRYFKQLHRDGSSVACMYDWEQQPNSGRGPEEGEPVYFEFHGARIEGLTHVTVPP